RVAGAPKFSGGCVGFWGYDVIRTIERLPKLAKRDLSVPDYLFMRMNEVWILDHEEQAVYCINHQVIEAECTEQQLRAAYDRAAGQAEGMVDYWLTWFESEQQRAKAEQERSRKWLTIEAESLHINVEELEGLSSPFE